ncbi:protein adenylyltransferase SelO [Aporhodopirellula aestuarii]|uniref:Protein nucleotidyltransferase YdiU n=1 Tax=Aporhodopirellula aestuarii TaxID=2950107 RepID=A0ABT0U9Z2_9BACT|nr:YdiU family protein [Aporhodopirellula aestuarii]MCM2373813.1 YdiU family protein [Aporhodopirellula aestuarii]
MPFRFDNTYARLPDAFYASVTPSPVSNPSIIRVNHDLAAELGIDAAILDSKEGAAILSGNQLAEGSEPIAMAYCGHQFGGFSPQLGDGRAILLGEVVRPDGVRFDIHLKGSGPTPFSRGGDGRSALGPVLREYIVSEAMASLGVPTTRALAAVVSGDRVYRECPMAGGVFTRVARSHVRIGTFQWFAAREDQANLKILADYVINRHYPEAVDSEQPYLSLLEGVIERQAKLIAHWMQLGFIHGVMNTDNMSVSGETIDYGPCAFMDTFHPAKTFSSIDHQGRYAFAKQSSIGQWNLSRFAETLLPLLDDDSPRAVLIAEAALEAYSEIHYAELQKRFFGKIGIVDGSQGDWALVETLLSTMAENSADFTLVFRHLADAIEQDDISLLETFFDQPDAITSWFAAWQSRLRQGDVDAAISLMRRSNPVYIPRNHRVEQAIAAAYEGDFSLFHRLTDVLQKPFTPREEFAEYEDAPQGDEVVQATFCGT